MIQGSYETFFLSIFFQLDFLQVAFRAKDQCLQADRTSLKNFPHSFKAGSCCELYCAKPRIHFVVDIGNEGTKASNLIGPSGNMFVFFQASI